MKKRIAILGSTGSIGKTTFNIIKENKRDFNVVLLTTNQNIKEIIKQTRQVKVENILVSNKKKFLKLKDKLKKSKIKIFNNFKDLNKIIKKRLDYTMCAISGLDGLNPTINIIKSTKNIAIANKESIICGWNLIHNELKKKKYLKIQKI